MTMDILYFFLLSGSILVITMLLKTIIDHFNYKIQIDDSFKLKVKTDDSNDDEICFKNISLIRGYLDNNLKNRLTKKYDYVIKLSDYYDFTESKVNTINTISNCHKMICNYIFDSNITDQIIILCSMNTPRDYFDIVNYILVNNMNAYLEIMNINPSSENIKKCDIAKYRKRKIDYFTYSLKNDFTIKKILKTLTHTILTKDGEQKYNNKIQAVYNKENEEFESITSNISEEYRNDDLNVFFGLINNDESIDAKQYINNLQYYKIVENNYYKIIFFTYNVNKEFEKNYISYMPKYAFAVLENNVDMPINNFFKLADLLKN